MKDCRPASRWRGGLQPWDIRELRGATDQAGRGVVIHAAGVGAVVREYRVRSEGADLLGQLRHPLGRVVEAEVAPIAERDLSPQRRRGPLRLVPLDGLDGVECGSRPAGVQAPRTRTVPLGECHYLHRATRFRV